MKQIHLFKKFKSDYGGELMKKRAGRRGPRPIVTRSSMHLVLRSTKAKGAWSFRTPQNHRKIMEIVNRFSNRFGIQILSLANVGNHLHFHIKIGNRYAYKPFIQAVTAAIAMAITGQNRWSKSKLTTKCKFWDYRPFTRVIQGFRDYLNLNDYIHINRLEGFGYHRDLARWFVRDQRKLLDG